MVVSERRSGGPAVPIPAERAAHGRVALYPLSTGNAGLTADGGLVVAAGFLAAFATALLVVRWFIAFVGRHGFAPSPGTGSSSAAPVDRAAAPVEMSAAQGRGSWVNGPSTRPMRRFVPPSDLLPPMPVDIAPHANAAGASM